MLKISVKDKRGLTLLEMLVVIFIISLVLAVIFPSFYGFGLKGAEDDARLMASVIRYLDDTSRNTKKATHMILDLDEKTVSYPKDAENVIKKIGSLYSVKLTSVKEKSSGSIKVDFQPSGLYERLAVRFGKDPELLTVLFNPYSGRIIIEKETGETKKRGNS